MYSMKALLISSIESCNKQTLCNLILSLMLDGLSVGVPLITVCLPAAAASKSFYRVCLLLG